MAHTIHVDEVSEFREAIAGVEIDWLRTDRGTGPACSTFTEVGSLAVSAGRLDFSALLQTEIPRSHLVLQLTVDAPDGLRWSGSDAAPHELRIYPELTTVFGNVPAGTSALTVVAKTTELELTAERMGLTLGPLPRTPDPLPSDAHVAELIQVLLELNRDPAVIERPAGEAIVRETIVRALARPPAGATSGRGFDSREIVRACIDHVEATGRHRPPISELCGVAHASESRLRQAFVDVFDVPPAQFFQRRTLSLLRDRLYRADPATASVTDAAMALGLTQLGRTAGRYRSLYGETPIQTLRRRPRGLVPRTESA